MAKEVAKTQPATMAEYVTSISTQVMNDLNKRKASGLIVPKNYAPANALAAALFKIQETVDRDKRAALSVCTPDSVKQALTEMLVKGLDPNKTQCYFIVYGKKLTCFESYFGLVHRAKIADPNIKEIYSEIVYAKDKFAYTLKRGAKQITMHEQDPDNIDLKDIKGAYAVIVYKDDTEIAEYMSWAQILGSWSKSQTKDNSDTHKVFADQMAQRTVLKRLVKSVVNTSDDSVLLADVDYADEQADAQEATEYIDVTPPEEDIRHQPEPEPQPEPQQQEQQPAADPIAEGWPEELPEVLG